MGIVTRFVRLCKADIHGVMDQMEDKGLMLKQCLRDMEEELDRKEARLALVNATLQEAKRERERVGVDGHKLEQDLELALDKDKDDIARMLIRKLKPLESHARELDAHVDDLNRECAALAESLRDQKTEYESLKLRTARHLNEAERRRFHSERHGAWLGPATELAGDMLGDSGDAEIELELLQRKEARAKTTSKGGAS